MKNLQKFWLPIIIAVMVLSVVGGGAYIYNNNKVEAPVNVSDTTNNVSTTTTDTEFDEKIFLTVISPNGGEVIPYGDIYMAGDLTFRWQSSQGENYKPSSNFKAYILNEKDLVVRDDLINTISSIGGGIFTSSFIGETKIKTNKKYKIKICDYIDSKEYCDISDDYFIIN